MKRILALTWMVAGALVAFAQQQKPLFSLITTKTEVQNCLDNVEKMRTMVRPSVVYRGEPYADEAKNIKIFQKNGSTSYTYNGVKHYGWQRFYGANEDYSDPYTSCIPLPYSKLTFTVNANTLTLTFDDAIQTACGFGGPNNDPVRPADFMKLSLGCKGGSASYLGEFGHEGMALKVKIHNTCTHRIYQTPRSTARNMRNAYGATVRVGTFGSVADPYAPWRSVHRQTTTLNFAECAKLNHMTKQEFVARLMLCDQWFVNKESLYEPDSEARQVLFYALWNIFKFDLESFSGLDMLVNNLTKTQNAEGMNLLGLCYELGQGGLERNIPEAIKWYKNSTELGNLDAAVNLAGFYLLREGVETDYPALIPHLIRAAEKDRIAMQQLAMCYENGYGVEKDIKQAVEWYKKAMNHGNKSAIVSYGRCCQNGLGVEKDLVKAYNLFQKAAVQKEHAGGMYELAKCYEYGLGVQPNPSEAARWYLRAAEGGNEKAMFRTAQIYEQQGYYDRAGEWNLKAAQKGNVDAMNKVGQAYYSLSNNEEAGKWWKQAAEKGNPSSMYNIARLYEIGLGVEKNEAEAFRWYKKAWENNFADAYSRLLYCYENGVGVEPDYEKAMQMYKVRADEGDTHAQARMGVLYYKGLGVPQDYEKAVKLLLTDEDTGDAEVLYCLGCCYRDGTGLELKKKKAVKCFRKAARSGHEGATKALEAMGEKP